MQQGNAHLAARSSILKRASHSGKGNLELHMQGTLLRLFRDFSLRTRILNRTQFNVYPYMHEPHQLEFLLQSMREIQHVPGACVEVGCAYGATTALLRKQLQSLGCTKRYIAIDTFAGFVASDVEHEVNQRGKDRELSTAFRVNKREWVERSLELAEADGVELVEIDCSKFDYRALGEIAFCLIDVDLYQPVRAVLEAIYSQLAPGAIVVVDDCQPHEWWDGALQAYMEFVEKSGLPAEIVCGKFGVIRKEK